MKLNQAESIAREIVDELRPGCDRIEIAGSIRRGKSEVKDIEIVFIPHIVYRITDLFGAGEPVPATDPLLGDLIYLCVLKRDEEVKRWGPKYKRGIHVASSMVVELFRAEPDNWGYIFALRTGPAEFNHLLVSRDWQGGAMPPNLKVQDGYLWRNGQLVVTPDEETFFAEVGIPCWPPEERPAGKLAAFLANRETGS